MYFSYRLAIWNKLEASSISSSSTLNHVKIMEVVLLSADLSFCVHKRNCKILYGNYVMQFDTLKELLIHDVSQRCYTNFAK
jgi:hypothetical protein